MADFSTEEGALVGDIIRKLLERGTGQSEARRKTAEREALVKQGASPADIFADEQARREQALAGQNILGAIGSKLPGLVKAPIIGGVFSPGEPLPAPARTQEELLKASAERRAEEQNVRLEEAGGRAKAKLPMELMKLEAETAKLGRTKDEDLLKHIPAETAQQILAGKEAGKPITIQEAIDKRAEYEATLSAARKDSPETRRAAVDLKKQGGAVKRAENALKAAQTSYDKLPSSENRNKIAKAQADLDAAVRMADQAAESLKGSYGQVAPARAARALTGSLPTTTQAEKVVVEKDGKQYRLPAAQLDEALKQGYKQVK